MERELRAGFANQMPAHVRMIGANALHLVMAQIPVLGAQLLTLTALARCLSAEQLGVYGTLVSSLGIASALVEQGIGRFVTYGIAGAPGTGAEVLRSGLNVALVLAAGTHLLILAAAWAAHVSASLLILTALFGLSVWPRNLWLIIGAGLAGHQRFGVSVILIAVAPVARAVLTILAVTYGYELRGACVAYSIAELFTVALGAVIALPLLREALKRPARLSGVVGMLRAALPFVLRAFSGAIRLRFTVLWLSRSVGLDQVGPYYGAQRLYELALAPAGLLHTAAFPVLARLHEGSKRDLRRFVGQSFAASIVVAGTLGVLLWTSATPLVRVLLGDHLGLAAVMLRWLAASVAVTYAIAPLVACVVTSRLQREATLIDLGSLALNIAACGVLIPKLGWQGGVYGTLASQVMLAFAVGQLTVHCLREPDNGLRA